MYERVGVPRASYLRLPPPGVTRAGLICGDNGGMASAAEGETRRFWAAARRVGAAVGSTPRALTFAGALLALAACAQAAVQAAMLSRAIGPRVVHVGAAATPATGTGANQALLYAVPLCLLALAATVPLIFLRPTAAAVAITVASVLSLAAFGAVTTGGQTAGLMTAGGLAAQVIAVYRLGAAGTARYLALGLTAPFLVLALAGRGGLAGVLLASAVPLAAGAGIAVRSRDQASAEDVARSELAESLVEHMARGERARIARELHDVVAHHISVISVQAETARLTTSSLSAEGAQRFREIGDTARAGLTEMRRLLGVLRPDVTAEEVGERQPQPGLPQITSLIDESRLASSGGVRLIVSGPVASFDPGVELAAYRIVQEALTNARRHAPGAGVDVELRYERDVLRVRIRDNGPGPSGALGGHGLVGMRERAATVGGSLRAGEAPGGGFLVEADLPAKPEAG
jgi:signal transduction histidine kinase